MNEYQKALDKLCELGRKELTFREICEMEIAVETLQKLVEKATPKKPIEYPSFASGYKCPNCESNIVLHGSHKICPTPCCSWCGQALDWSEEDVNN